MVDESDIGKIRAGMPATVIVTSFPNQPFEGLVSKIEPQALAEETVTTFAVLIVLDNENRLLRPGMNADVEIRIAERRDVVAVPTVALRTRSDINVSSELVGLSPADVNAMLRDDQERSDAPRMAPAAGQTRLPPDSAGETNGYRFESRYWVLLDEPGGPRAVNVTTGLTDLDYSEVLSGLAEDDEVLLLPSSGLILAQKRFQEQMRRFMSMPGMGGKDDDKKGNNRSGRSSRGSN